MVGGRPNLRLALSQARRLSKNYERLPETGEAMVLRGDKSHHAAPSQAGVGGVKDFTPTFQIRFLQKPPFRMRGLRMLAQPSSCGRLWVPAPPTRLSRSS